jgi:hypothetical protein
MPYSYIAYPHIDKQNGYKEIKKKDTSLPNVIGVPGSGCYYMLEFREIQGPSLKSRRADLAV